MKSSSRNSTHDARLMSCPPVDRQTELAKFQATVMSKILKHLLWCVSQPLSQTPRGGKAHKGVVHDLQPWLVS